MEIDYEAIILVASNLFNGFLGSGFFWFVKFILAIYVTVLFVDMVLLLVLRGLGGDLRDTLKGAQMPISSKKKIKKKWSQIEERLKTKNQSQFKIAILEADSLADEMLFNIGYGGKNMKERLDAADANQVEEIDNLREGHEIRNRVIFDDNFVIGEEETLRVIGLYREFLENLEVI